MKMDVFKTAPKVYLNLGYFCKKICHRELSKIAQSGHTASDRLSLCPPSSSFICSLSFSKQYCCSCSTWLCEGMDSQFTPSFPTLSLSLSLSVHFLYHHDLCFCPIHERRRDIIQNVRRRTRNFESN